MTTGEPHCPSPGSVMPWASRLATADCTMALILDNCRGGDEIGGVSPVYRRPSTGWWPPTASCVIESVPKLMEQVSQFHKLFGSQTAIGQRKHRYKIPIICRPIRSGARSGRSRGSVGIRRRRPWARRSWLPIRGSGPLRGSWPLFF